MFFYTWLMFYLLGAIPALVLTHALLTYFQQPPLSPRTALFVGILFPAGVTLGYSVWQLVAAP
jgi:hypothetical protein